MAACYITRKSVSRRERERKTQSQAFPMTLKQKNYVRMLRACEHDSSHSHRSRCQKNYRRSNRTRVSNVCKVLSRTSPSLIIFCMSLYRLSLVCVGVSSSLDRLLGDYRTHTKWNWTELIIFMEQNDTRYRLLRNWFMNYLSCAHVRYFVCFMRESMIHHILFLRLKVRGKKNLFLQKINFHFKCI